MSIKNKFGLFLLINLIVWSLLPLLRLSLPMDTQEAIVWGHFSLLGTTKHPPLSGMVAYGFYRLFGGVDGFMYLLSQLCVMLGIYYIYRLARLFIDENKAVVASMLQLGVIYYNFSTAEFNVNLLSVALWPMCAYYFWNAYLYNRWKDWVLLGLLCGLNLLNKYVGGLLLMAFGLFTLTDAKGRKLFFNPKFYVAGAIGLAVMAPHLWWLYDNNFVMLNYMLERKAGKNVMTSQWRHLFYPLKFLFAQVLYGAVALLTYAVFYKKSEKEAQYYQGSASKFLLICAFFPLLFFALTSLIGGTPLKSMWGFPCLFLIGICLVYFFPLKVDDKKAGKIALVMLVWSMIFALTYGVQCTVTRSVRFRSDSRAIVQSLNQKWNEYTQGQKLNYVVGEPWFANMFTLDTGFDVLPMIWGKTEFNPWLSAGDFKQRGALVVAENYDEYARYQKRFGKNITEPYHILWTYQSISGRTKEREIIYGFYGIKGAGNGK